MEKGKAYIFRLFVILIVLIGIGHATSGYCVELTNNNWDGFGSWFQKNWITNGSSIITDETSPDAPNVLRFFYPSGYAGGNAPATVGYKAPYPVQEYYVQYYFKYSPNWEWHPVADKQMYIYSEPSHSDSHCAVMTWYGRLVFSVGGPSYPNGSKSIYNTPTWFPERNRWYKLNLHVKMNNPKGVANGIVELWIDDVRIIYATDVMYLLASSNDTGFQSFNISPVFGGAGSVKTHDDFVLFDKTIISASAINTTTIPNVTTYKIPNMPVGLEIK